MKFVLYLWLPLAFILPVFSGDEIDVYFGTYTRGESKGIYRSQFNTKSGELGKAVLVAEVENPSFLALSPDEKHLYAVIENGKFENKVGGGLAAFSIQKDGLRKLNARNTGGAHPCHVSIDPAGKAVLVANYSGGNVAAYPIAKDGKIGSLATLVQHEGSSINERRQKGPHAHAINIFGGGKFAAAADLGTDSIFVYQLEPGKASLKLLSEIKLKPGSGARHIAFHPTEKFAYVINEMTLTVAGFSLESETEWKPIQYLSTLPEGDRPTGSTAEIQMHPSGRFLYGSNRGHDTVVVYEIDQETGILKWIENEPIQGSVPRNFNISPDGKYLLAAGQKSNSVAVFAIDQENGTLEFMNQKIKVPSPVCIVFRSQF